MRHTTSKANADLSTFGSLPGQNAIEAMKMIQLTYENHRIFTRPMITIFNDAAGCYDQIRQNMADIAMRRIGCPRSMTQTLTKSLLQINHKIKTALGISPGTLQ